MTLKSDFQRNWQAQGWADPQQHGLVAVSTGVDSMVLLQLLMTLPVTMRPKLTVVHVNHQLRQQSQTEAAFLKKWCAAHQIPLVTTKWPIDQHPSHGVEAAARAFRYDFFAQQLHQQKADWVATAHQADEQVETILLKLIRGGQLAQLTGMAASRPLAGGRVIRPLLPFTKERLKAYAREQQVPWYEDATNQELIASRNRVRHQLIPLLKQENPQVVEHVMTYAQQLQATLMISDQALDQQLQTIMTRSDNVAGLLRHSIAEQRLLLTRLIKQQAPTISAGYPQIDQCLQLLANGQHPTGSVVFSEGWQLTKSYTHFRFWQPKKNDEKSVEHFRFMVDLDQWQSIGHGRQLGCFTTDTAKMITHETIALTTTDFPLMVREWQAGDRLRLRTGHHQPVRRALINAKIPREQRAQQQVLVTAQGTVLAVLGVKWAVRPPRSHTKNYHIGLKAE